jgi:hypothetical protein
MESKLTFCDEFTSETKNLTVGCPIWQFQSAIQESAIRN